MAPAEKPADLLDNSVEGRIDISLTEHTVRLSYEERLEAHESARQLVKDLQKAGQEYHARQSKKSA